MFEFDIGEKRYFVAGGKSGHYHAVRTLLVSLWGNVCAYADALGGPGECPYCEASGWLDCHHAFIEKNDNTRMSPEDQLYADHPLNCVLICHLAHMQYQGSRDLRDLLFVLQSKRYGRENLVRYLLSAPGKIAPEKFWPDL